MKAAQPERAVGSDLGRPDGPDKVTGRAVYVADIDPRGCWWGGVVRSPAPSGSLIGFDFDADFDPGSVVIVGPGDIPGDNVVSMIVDDQPILAAGIVRHWGEPLLLVAAPDRETLARALAAIHARIEPREAVFDMERSQLVQKRVAIQKGDARSALERAAWVIEGSYRTDTQEQMYIETQGCIAWPPKSEGPEGEVLVRGSMQCPYYVQKAVARALAIEPALARVAQTVTGGGFGGKEDYPSQLACHAALLARACGQPVRMILDRHEDLSVTPKRHPARIRHRTAVDARGNLLAMEIDVLLDGGAYTTLSPVVLSRACIHAAGPYRCDHVTIEGRAVATNHVPYGAFRGFGAPQVCFAVERHMDRIARALGLHPAELRQRNMLRLGDTTATGQRLETSVGSEPVMQRILERSGFDRYPWCAPKTGRVRRGVGFSFFFHGAGFTGSGEEMLRGKVAVDLTAGGTARVRTAQTEFGQGTLTMLRAIAADSLGLAPEDVQIAEPDTQLVPNSGPTVASRTCMIVGGCVQRACAQLVRKVEENQGREGSFAERATACARELGELSFEVEYASPPGLTWDEDRYRGDAYPAYGWAADVAEVEVDLATFEVRVVRFLTAVDVGKAIVPGLVEGQIEGGSLQAIGFAHLEVVSMQDGRTPQDRMATCIIPTTLDTPPMQVELIEVPYPNGPFGAKGVGELPMDGGAPAVASAIEDATGILVDRIPATPERLLQAWLRLHPEEVL